MGTGRALRQFNPAIKVDVVSAGLAVPRARRAEAHGDGDGAGASTMRRSPTRTCASAPRRRTGWCGGWRAKKGCSSGISSGAALAATLAGRTHAGLAACVVTVFPDGAEKYLTESFWTADDDGHTRACVLEAGVAAAIRRHGEETYPHECCGALVGRGGHVDAAVALPNTTEEGPRRRFLVRPSDYRLAEQRATRAREASCSGSITRIPTIRRGRRSSTSTTRGRPSRT